MLTKTKFIFNPDEQIIRKNKENESMVTNLI
jgi:hypothetical protein